MVLPGAAALVSQVASCHYHHCMSVIIYTLHSSCLDVLSIGTLLPQASFFLRVNE